MVSKGEMRSLLKSILLDIPLERLQLKSKNLSRRLSSFLEELPKSPFAIPEKFIIGGFCPLKDEVDWTCDQSIRRNYENRVAFPALVVGKDEMKFYLSRFEDLKVRNDFGVSIFGPGNLASVCSPHCLLIPGLGFSFKGERIGRGKGFYDRYLKDYKGLKVGLCFDEQLREGIPCREHDQLMNLIITDTRTIEIGANIY